MYGTASCYRDDVFREDIEFQRSGTENPKQNNYRACLPQFGGKSPVPSHNRSRPDIGKHSGVTAKEPAVNNYSGGTCGPHCATSCTSLVTSPHEKRLMDVLWMFGDSGAKWLPRDARSDLVPSRS